MASGTALKNGMALKKAHVARYEDIVDATCAWHPHCRPSKLFGIPCVKRGGTFVFGLWRDGMLFKLTDPALHARALGLAGAHLFDPSGRGEAFRQWVVVPPAGADEWEALAYEAVGQDHARWENQDRRSPSRKTTVFRPDSSTTSK